MTPAELIAQYQAIKKTKELMDAEYKASIKPYADAMDDIELSLLEYLNANGLQNVKTPEGTAYKTTHVGTKMVDRQAVIDFCIEGNNFDIFTNSLTKEVVKAYLEANNKPPPGVEVAQTIVVNIRKS